MLKIVIFFLSYFIQFKLNYLFFYRNYAVQYVAKMKIPSVNAEIMLQLQGRYAQLSTNKHASNVVEHLLEFSEEKDAANIIQELMYTQNFLRIIQDPYGNYVVQRALQNCKVTQSLTLTFFVSVDHFFKIWLNALTKGLLFICRAVFIKCFQL